MLLVLVGMMLTLGLFLLVSFVGLLTYLSGAKNVALGVATVTVTVAGKFVYNLVDMLTGTTAVSDKAVAADFIMLAITVTTGLLALTVVLFVDKKFGQNQEP